MLHMFIIGLQMGSLTGGRFKLQISISNNSNRGSILKKDKYNIYSDQK